MAIDPYLGFTLAQDGEVTNTNLVAAQTAIAAAFRNTFISGLELEWVSASSIKVRSGGAWWGGPDIPGVYWIADTTVSGISLGNNTWGHVYLHAGGGGPIEITTTAPEFVVGTTYKKTGNPTHRYLGSVRTNGSGNIWKFTHQGNVIAYVESTYNSPFRVLAAGAATTKTNVDCSAVVPVTSRVAVLRVNNTVATPLVYIGTPDDNTTGTNGIRGFGQCDTVIDTHPLDSLQRLSYLYSAGGGSLYLDVAGYEFSR